MAGSVSAARQEIANAIKATEEELRRLREAEAVLAKLDGGSAPRRARITSTTTRRRASSGNGRRRRGGRSAQALKLITDNPGITIPDLAQRMKIAPNYLYRVIPQLQKDGQVKKDGKGWVAA